MQFLNLSVFLAFGMLVVHVTPVLEAANALAGTFFAMFNLLCGFMKASLLSKLSARHAAGLLRC